MSKIIFRVVEQREQRIRSLYYKLLFINDYSRFANLVNSRLNNYFSKLSTAYPLLNEKDFILTFLYLLDISDNDILLLTGYSPNSLPTIKTRLCKKLQIVHATDLRKHLLRYVE